MVHEAYYLIAPNARAREVLRGFGGDTADVVGQSQLWRKDEPDRSPWSREDHLVQVKVLFLAWFMTEYGALPEGRALLPGPNLDLAAFEKHWTLERFYFPESVEMVEGQVSTEAVAAVALPDDSIPASWLADLKAQKSAAKKPGS